MKKSTLEIKQHISELDLYLKAKLNFIVNDSLKKTLLERYPDMDIVKEKAKSIHEARLKVKQTLAQPLEGLLSFLPVQTGAETVSSATTGFYIHLTALLDPTSAMEDAV